ncbi:MAG: hypothetical protein ACOYW4_10085 [Bacillota bacterium]
MPRGMLIAMIVLGAVCVVSLGAVLLRPAPPEPPPPSLPVSQDGPGIAVEQTRFVGRSGGARRWEFDADEVRVKQGESRVALAGIRNGVFYNGNRAWLSFSAARAEVDTATNDLKLEDVSFTSEEGDRLSADTLTWSEKDEKVVIEGNVRVERNTSSVLLCEKAEYHLGENVLETVGKTTVEIELPEE